MADQEKKTQKKKGHNSPFRSRLMAYTTFGKSSPSNPQEVGGDREPVIQ
jgi:hypothetical protein